MRSAVARWRRRLFPPAPRKTALDAALLEDRVLLSATPLVGVDFDLNEPVTALPEPVETLDELVWDRETHAAGALPDGDAQGGFELPDDVRGELDRRLELVFVDTGAGDYQQLVDDLLALPDETRELEVYLLDSGRDGVTQISEILEGYDDLAALHLVSHGNPGQVALGSTTLSMGTLDGYAGQITSWNDALRDGADLLIYGCDLAADAAGRSLTDALGSLCDCDVAASVDDTGHAAFGGDWELEYATGNIETSVAFSSVLQQNWAHLLDVTVDNTTASTASTGAASHSFSHATAGASRLLLVGVSFGEDKGDTVTSVTYNGANLTLVGARDNSDPSQSRVEIWGLAAPDTGAHNVLVNFSGTNHEGAIIGATTFNDVDQLAPWGGFAAAQGDSANLSTTVSSSTKDLVFGVAALSNSNDETLTAGGGQTQQWELHQDKANGAGSTEAGANSVTTSWTSTASGKWVAAGVSVKELTLVVDSTDDYGAVDPRYGDTATIAALFADKGSDGRITLREAIDAANNDPGPDTIRFNLPDNDPRHFYYQDDTNPGALSLVTATVLDDASIGDFDPDYPYAPHSWFSIDLNSALPRLEITDPVNIDGYTQPGAAVNSLSVGDNAELRIELTSSGADGNRGLTVEDGGDGSTIRGLTIHGFDGAEILVEPGADGVTIQGNFLGTDITGTLGQGDGDAGAHLRSSNNLLGGPNPADRNVLSGNDGRGVVTFTFGPIATGNVVENNYIGVDVTGLKSLTNITAGIQVYNQDGMQIRDNVISGNTGDGIWLRAGSTKNNTTIRGNLIGVGADGITSIANTGDGILIEDDATGTVIGGGAGGDRNVISGNAGYGVRSTGNTVDATTIQGNSIGVDTAGGPLGNGNAGIRIDDNSDNNLIGGTAAGQGNTVAYNAGDGVLIVAAASQRNAIQGNSIYANTGHAIDLNNDSINANDTDDADSGTNNLQNSPVITSAATDGTQLTVSGYLHSTPGGAQTYRIEFFGSDELTSSGGGQGEKYLGFADVDTDQLGNTTGIFQTSIAVAVSPGVWITGTATDSLNNTSEFSTGRAASSELVSGDEFVVNTETNGGQRTSSENRGSTRAVAAAPNGDYVVAWSSFNQDAGGWGVFAQRFDKQGAALGAEIPVNADPVSAPNDQQYASVAMDPAGDFVVAWSGDGPGDTDGVFFRRFNAAGVALDATEVLANVTTGGSQDAPTVSRAANGDFVIVWEGNGPGDTSGIFARRFAANGVPLDANEVLANTTTGGTQSEPSVAMSDSGRYAVVWDDGGGFHARIFDEQGNPQPSQLTIDGSSSAGEGTVAMDANGDFVAVWRETAIGRAVYMRRYDSVGTPLSAASLVNTTSAGDQTNPSIAMNAAGSFVVVWEGNGSEPDNVDADGVFGRRYDDQGTALDAKEFRINQTTLGVQDRVSAALLGTESFVAVWTGSDADQDGVFARQFGTQAGQQGLFLSTESDVSGTTANGPLGWGQGDLLTFGGASFQLEPPTTAGSVGIFASLAELGDGDVDIDAIHYVSSNLTIGNTFQVALSPGDLILSTQGNESFLNGKFSVDQADTFVFKPVSPGNYSSGTFEMLMDASADPDLSFGDLRGVSLVEQDVNVGGTALTTGQLLFARSGLAEENDVYVFDATEVGLGTTAGTVAQLIEGDDVNVNQKLFGLELIEASTALGGAILPSGSLLLTLDNEDAAVGDNSISVTRRDVFYLDVTQALPTNADATLLFEGLDVGLQDITESLDALGVAANRAPTLIDTVVTLNAVDEDAGPPIGPVGTLVTSLVDFPGGGGRDNVTDPDPTPKTGIAVIAADTANGSWFYSTDNGGNWNPLGAVAINNARLLAADANSRIAFQGNLDYNGTIANAITFRAWDQTSGSNGATVDTTANGGLTAYSTATDTASLIVNSVNDDPTADATAGQPYVINEGAAVTLDAGDSADSDGTIVSYEWDLDNDSIFGEPGESTGVNPLVTWATLQSFGIDDDGPAYTIGLRVWDDDGKSDTTTTTLTVNNTAPTLTTSGAATVSDGGLYTLNLSSSDPGNDSLSSWTINWGDGTVETVAGNPPSTTHTYSGAGLTYNILASATDEDGTFLQNELLVSSYATGDSVFRYRETTGVFLQEFATAEGLDDPIDVVIGPDGNLYVTGEGSDHVLRYNAVTGAFIDEFVTVGDGGLNSPGGLAFGLDGNLYVASYATDEVLRYDGTTGAFIDAFVSAGSGGLNESFGLTFGPDRNLYVNSFGDDQVLKYDGTSGAFMGVFVSPGSGGLSTPEQMIFGPDGNLYVASYDTDEVLRYNGITGAFMDDFVAAGLGGLDKPAGLAFGPDGNLYVGDYQDATVLRYHGTTGAFIDEYVAGGSGGLVTPAWITFLPGQQVTVTGVNSAPVLADTVVTLNSVVEDAGPPLGAVGTLIRALADSNPPAGGQDNVTDPDVSPQTGVAITAADTGNGAWHYSIDNGVSWHALGAVSDAAARVLAADASTRIYFQADADYEGTLANALTFRAWDQTDGNLNGAAGVDTTTNGGGTAYSGATDVAALTVSPLNDPPVLAAIEGLALGYVEGAGQVAITSSLTVADIDDANLVSARIQITGNYAPGEDILAFVDTPGISGSWDPVTGRLNLAGGDTLANYAGALRSVSYQNSSPTPSTLTRIVSFTVDDGSDPSNLVARQISVSPINDRPTLTNFAVPVETTAEDTVVEVSLTDLRAAGDEADVDGSVAAFVVKSLGSGTLRIGSSAAAADPWAAGTNDTIDAVNQAYWIPPLNANGTLAALDVVAQDDAGDESIGAVTAQIEVTPVNDPPVASADHFEVNGHSSLIISVGGVLQNDADVEGDPLSAVLLSGSTHGSLVLNADGSFTYTPHAGFSNPDSFLYEARDGQGGSATAMVTITVKPAVGPPPPLTAPTLDEETPAEEPPVEEETSVVVLPGEGDVAQSPASAPATLVRQLDLSQAIIGPPPIGPRPLTPVTDGGAPQTVATFASESIPQDSRTARRVIRPAVLPVLQRYVATFDTGLLWDDLSELEEDLQDYSETPYFAVGSAAGMTGALTVGYVLWTIRSGLLATSLLAQMPAWRLVDPLVVLDYLDGESDEEDDDSLESMLSRANAGKQPAELESAAHPATLNRTISG